MNYNIQDWIEKGQELARNILRGKHNDVAKENNFKYISDLSDINNIRAGFEQYSDLNAKYSKSYKDLPKEPSLRFKLWKYAGAAAAVLISALLINLYYFNSDFIERNETQKTEEIVPGNQKAYLKLSDGRLISLDKTTRLYDSIQGEITNIDGRLTIGPGSDHQSIVKHHIFVPKGGEYSMVLSDGTKVWLNAGSELEFPSSFEGQQNREVRLKGEGYFEIASNKKQPFYVQSNAHRVMATGTAFNISDYSNDPEYTVTLLEGGVYIIDQFKNVEKLLPDQEYAFLRSTSSFKKKTVIAANRVGWVKGKFVFKGEPLAYIMNQIERWYDVDVELKGSQLATYHFSGVISRNISIHEFLETLKMTNEIDYKIINRKISIYPKK